MSDAIRLQRLAPADTRREEGAPPGGQLATPADPAPVESPQRLEALVADLEAAIRNAVMMRATWQAASPSRSEYWHGYADALREIIATKRSGSATGGNEGGITGRGSR